MVILIDRREQRQLKFPRNIQTRMDTLPFGDYCAEVDGKRIPLVWERKSLDDLFSTLTIAKNHDRFRREMLAAQEANVVMILGIEGTLSQVLTGVPYSRAPGESVVKAVFTCWVKYGLRPVFCQSRVELARHIVECFSAIERNWELAL